MATQPDDDLDMPELTDEMLAEFRTPLTEMAHVDLHIGAVQIKSLNPAVPAPFDLTSIVVNAVVSAGYLALAWLFVQAWAWVLSS